MRSLFSRYGMVLGIVFLVAETFALVDEAKHTGRMDSYPLFLAAGLIVGLACGWLDGNQAQRRQEGGK